MNTRLYPLVPVADWLPVWSAPWDGVFFGVVLVALVVSAWWHRPGMILFLAGAVFLALGDQNRWQPWFYLYGVLLALTLLPEASGVAGMRFVVSAVYVWSGVQKCNVGFYQEVVPFFLQPMTGWLWAGLVPVAKVALMATPLVEMAIGVGLWVPRLRRAAVVLAVVVHGVALLVLGPLGHKHNLVVWPWNVAMGLLVVILFPAVRVGDNWRELRRSWAGLVGVGLVVVLPVLSFVGVWDSYLSFSLYSGNLSKADMFVSTALAERLPPQVQKMLNPMAANYDVERQGPWVVNHQGWAVLQLGVPPLPEPRGYRAVGRYVASFAVASGDFHMVVVTRGGVTNYYDGGKLR